jgi:hypothetical protein
VAFWNFGHGPAPSDSRLYNKGKATLAKTLLTRRQEEREARSRWPRMNTRSSVGRGCKGPGEGSGEHREMGGEGDAEIGSLARESEEALYSVALEE